jgi:hypothetical protein
MVRIAGCGELVAETSNISKIAEILANDLFARFLWHDTGGWNQNWSCVRDDHKVKKSRSQVPSSSEGPRPRKRACRTLLK